jgi:hypothetical protein
MNSTLSVTSLKRNLLFCVVYSIPLLLSTTCQAQYRPSMFFREDWKETPPATPVNQDHVANPDLVLGLYGGAVDSMKKSNHERPVDDPYAKIKWRTKQSGFRCLRILLKLADGTWLVSDQCDCRSGDWRIREFNIADIKWYTLDIKTITERQPIDNPDLTKVDEIGFTDLMAGGRSAACSRVDWIEVYGKEVNR